MSYASLSGGRLTLVDLLGSIGVSGKLGCTPLGSGESCCVTGLLGGVTNDGEFGELGASSVLGVEGVDNEVSGIDGIGSKC